MNSAKYIGRFAPSPTGPLHFGSLLAAMASFCDAKSHHGIWLLRIDDIDPPRELPGAKDAIPRALEQFGFEWDGDIMLQSERMDLYREQSLRLNEKTRLYACNCSRKKLKDHSIYPGFCNPANAPDPIPDSKIQAGVLQQFNTADADTAVRVALDGTVEFHDEIQGKQVLHHGEHFGDTVVLRKDDLFAYALACAVDDSDDITHVVRGADLLPTTAVQIAIARLLEHEIPSYAHIPIALNEQQQKLSKQTKAEPIANMPVLATLLEAWAFLGQNEFLAESVKAFWQHAQVHWNLDKVPRQSQLNQSI